MNTPRHSTDRQRSWRKNALVQATRCAGATRASQLQRTTMSQSAAPRRRGNPEAAAHRYPFLLFDRVVELDADNASWRTRRDPEHPFHGHFSPSRSCKACFHHRALPRPAGCLPHFPMRQTAGACSLVKVTMRASEDGGAGDRLDLRSAQALDQEHGALTKGLPAWTARSRVGRSVGAEERS